MDFRKLILGKGKDIKLYSRNRTTKYGNTDSFHERDKNVLGLIAQIGFLYLRNQKIELMMPLFVFKTFAL